MNSKRFVVLVVLVASLAEAQQKPSHWSYALRPPMGWNSWDIFGTTVTEQQVKDQADAMAKHLLPAGYDILTVDIQWYEPNSVGHAYKPGAELEMDSYSRLLPGLKKFPSATNGQGFRALADYVHAKGLRFGIHIMRGIPRQAVHRNTPILGTKTHAADIANTKSICPWNPDMYGVDMTKLGAQAYYDSIFKLYASWGVDYVKVDDIARPYNDGQKAEIEAIRKAIDNSGRAMVLSLSPGATPIEAGEHVMRHANLWRITDDFWDRWPLLYAMFERVHTWTPYRRVGAWPDADMLPLGMVDFGRPTRFSKEEQVTLMTLWSIARSPLIFGGDMTKLDDFTIDLLTNPDMVQVNQHSTNNRQISRENNLIIWAADVPDSSDRYVALFNAQSVTDGLDFSRADYTSNVVSRSGDSVDISLPLEKAKMLVLMVKDGGDGFSYDHAVWVEPALTGPKGKLKLTNLSWTFAEAGWGVPRVDRTCEDRPLLVNRSHVTGIGTHANSTIIYELPEGYDTFNARAVLTHRGSVQFGVLTDSGQALITDKSIVTISFNDLGIDGKVRVRDLWAHKDLGTFSDAFSQALPRHAAGLFRISPIP